MNKVLVSLLQTETYKDPVKQERSEELLEMSVPSVIDYRANDCPGAGERIEHSGGVHSAAPGQTLGESC